VDITTVADDLIVRHDGDVVVRLENLGALEDRCCNIPLR